MRIKKTTKKHHILFIYITLADVDEDLNLRPDIQ